MRWATLFDLMTALIPTPQGSRYFSIRWLKSSLCAVLCFLSVFSYPYVLQFLTDGMLVREMMADPLLKKYRYLTALMWYMWFLQPADPVSHGSVAGSQHRQTEAAKWNLTTFYYLLLCFSCFDKIDLLETSQAWPEFISGAKYTLSQFAPMSCIVGHDNLMRSKRLPFIEPCT